MHYLVVFSGIDVRDLLGFGKPNNKLRTSQERSLVLTSIATPPHDASWNSESVGIRFCYFVGCIFFPAAAGAPVIGLRLGGERFIPIKETTVCCSTAPAEITKRRRLLDGRCNWKL